MVKIIFFRISIFKATRMRPPDTGFAQKYDEKRANECKDIPGDQYNASWKYGCIVSGLTATEIK
jgi:hypothetical protein